LRQLRSESPDALYLSADTLDRNENLATVVRRFASGYGIRRFFIDEIHFINEYAGSLKELFDFTDVEIWFTSSVALSLEASIWDLSRRVMRVALTPFSYREYLAFVEDRDFARLPLRTALTEPIDNSYLRSVTRFADYLAGGLHPFMLEPGSHHSLFENILSTVISRDIPRFDPSVTMEDLENIEKTARFIARSEVDGINYSSISRNIGITKYKAEKYLEYLERSFIVLRVFPEGTNVLKEPKVLMQLPYRTLHRSYQECIGALREDFFALAMEQHSQSYTYAKTVRGAKTPDFVIGFADETVVVEIGGVSKGRSQFKEVDYDRKVVIFHGDPSSYQAGQRVPLHCLGFA
jgi:predicted AAA+ superfamily ATPase